MECEYKIGEVAEMLDTTLRTIRYYEEQGLLQPLRTAGGTRVYTERHVARLQTILLLAKNGFSLEVIKLISSIRESSKSGDESSQKVSARLNDEIKKISARISELEKLKGEIKEAAIYVRKCRGCVNKPTSRDCPLCPVKKQINAVKLLSLIWDQDD